MRALIVLLWIPVFACFAQDKVNDTPVHAASIVDLAERAERLFIQRKVAFGNDTIDSYLSRIVNGMKVPGMDANIHLRVIVLKGPVFNAFASPNGVIYLFTGILARIENEAQLAALLGHEMTHIIGRHSIKNLVEKKAQSRKSALSSIGLEFFLGRAGAALGNIYLKSAITGYSRELEKEADSLGLIRMARAGYARIEFRNFFLRLREHIERENVKQSYFFSTHPTITNRLDNYYQMAGEDTAAAKSGARNIEVFINRIRPVILYDAKDNIARGKLDVAERELRRYLKFNPDDVEALCLIGDVFSLRRDSTAAAKAKRAYALAMEKDGRGGMSYKRMGFHYFKQGNRDTATALFSAWLRANPNTADELLVRKYLHLCD
jgi:predicted Zn-dependent protease